MILPVGSGGPRDTSGRRPSGDCPRFLREKTRLTRHREAAESKNHVERSVTSPTESQILQKQKEQPITSHQGTLCDVSGREDSASHRI